MAANSHSIDLESTSSQYLSIADASQTGLDITGNISIATWVNFESTPSSGNSMIIASKWNDTGGSANASWIFSLRNNGGTLQLRFFFSTSGSYQAGNDKAVNWTPSTATYYHLAVLKSGTTVKFYVNGSQQGADQTASNSTIYDSAAGFGIGARNIGGTPIEFFDGLQDETVVTADALTSAEITKLYQGYQANTFLDNLKGYWTLNNVLTDLSGNSNTLSNGNAATFSTTVPFANYLEDAGGIIFF